MKCALIVILCLIVGFIAGFYVKSLVNPTITQNTIPIQPSPTKEAVVTPITPTASPSATLANPASTFCTQKGGTLVIKTRGDGGQYGLCEFMDNYACEEWAMYRGDCPVNGLRTTGYSTDAEKYCAWLGGTTVSQPNATCTLKNGKVCNDDDLYNGKCTQ